jgi:hypothetical protein
MPNRNEILAPNPLETGLYESARKRYRESFDAVPAKDGRHTYSMKHGYYTLPEQAGAITEALYGLGFFTLETVTFEASAITIGIVSHFPTQIGEQVWHSDGFNEPMGTELRFDLDSENVTYDESRGDGSESRIAGKIGRSIIDEFTGMLTDIAATAQALATS